MTSSPPYRLHAVAGQLYFTFTLYKSENALPCSQQTVTGPYPQPDESNLHALTLFP
jgi:hypothetical protein